MKSTVNDLNIGYCQEYSMKYIYSTSQMSKLSLTLHTFSITGSVAGLFLTAIPSKKVNKILKYFKISNL